MERSTGARGQRRDGRAGRQARTRSCRRLVTLPSMPVTLTVNGHRIEAPAGVSLFTAAEQAGVRVPTSCVTQGKCKECVVEITRGMELLTPPTSYETHLDASSRFRLSCQCKVAADSG